MEDSEKYGPPFSLSAKNQIAWSQSGHPDNSSSIRFKKFDLLAAKVMDW